MIAALLRRDLRAIISDRGRIAELLVFPTSFVVIWGFLLRSGVIERQLASQLLVVNLIWTVSSQFQDQSNMCVVMDLWSREFSEIFRQGVTLRMYLLARTIFGTLVGFANLLAFFVALPLFGGGWHEMKLMLITLPVYYIASIAVSFVVAGAVLVLGRSYAFLAWTALQIIVMCSSPYSPIETLPLIPRIVALLSPFTYVFEYVRVGNTQSLVIGAAQAIVLLALGLVLSRICFQRIRSGAGLSSL